MRYRPLAHLPMAVSALSLKLDDQYQRSVSDWTALGMAALDCGINCFEVAGHSPALVDGLARALSTVERRLIYVAWRLGPKSMPPVYANNAFTSTGMEGLTKAALARTNLGYLDLVQLDDPGQQDLSADGLQTLRQMKADGLVRALGLAGDGDEIDTYISTGAFAVLTLPFSMLSGWRERRRLKAAGERNMSVLGADPYPEAMLAVVEAAKPKRGLMGLMQKPAGVAPAPYSFLHNTPEWTAEEICVAFALTEPAVATVQIEPRDADHLRALAALAERHLPAGLPAQIEMSHFTTLGKDQKHA